MLTSLPQIRHLPKQDQDKFTDQVIAHYLEKRPTLEQHGKITYFDYWVEVEATKGML